jgi:hypothetical protein
MRKIRGKERGRGIFLHFFRQKKIIVGEGGRRNTYGFQTRYRPLPDPKGEIIHYVRSVATLFLTLLLVCLASGASRAGVALIALLFIPRWRRPSRMLGPNSRRLETLEVLET